MSTTRTTLTEIRRGRIDVTERSPTELREFAAETAGDVHLERRAGRTYLVTEG